MAVLKTNKDIIEYIIKVYMGKLHTSPSSLPIQQEFDVVEEVYNRYLSTKDVNDLRYFFALCLRIRHGRRMPWINTREAVDKLIASSIISNKFTDFEALHAEVGRILKGINFAQGPLTVYDTALNIGYILKVLPKKKIYLYAGAWDGAKIIASIFNFPIRHIMNVSVWQAPSLFPGIDSMYIEDILCVFKDIFKMMSVKSPITTKDIDDKVKFSPFIPFSKEYALKRMQYII